MSVIQGKMNELLDKFQNYDRTKWVRSIEYDEDRQNVTVGDGYREVKYLSCKGMTANEVWNTVVMYVKSQTK